MPYRSGRIFVRDVVHRRPQDSAWARCQVGHQSQVEDEFVAGPDITLAAHLFAMPESANKFRSGNQEMFLSESIFTHPAQRRSCAKRNEAA
jgi:hypothetical protein